MIEISGDVSSIAKKDREVKFDNDNNLYTIDNVRVDDTISPAITHIEFEEPYKGKNPPEKTHIFTGNVVALLTYTELDIENNTAIYNDPWVRNMVTARLKYQWASNLFKFRDISLPGGVKFNAKELMNESKEDIKKLQKELEEKFSEPPIGYIG
jgi:hypothetical protein